MSSIHRPDELILRDVRCFQGVQRARLRPITLLVGENSTGKTTVLACYSAFHRMLSVHLNGGLIDFNWDPFSLGSFLEIVRSRRGREGRIREFQLGLAMGDGVGLAPYDLTATFGEQGSQPALKSWRYTFQRGGFLEFRRENDSDVTVAIEGHESSFPGPLDLWNIVFVFQHRDDWIRKRHPHLEPILTFITDLARGRRGTEGSSEAMLFPYLLPLASVAPLRAKPRRTYDPVRETTSPEGEHVPMLLMRLDHAKDERWKSLRNDLVAFGRNSGMFSEIKVKRHGRQMSDPFQLQMKAHSGSYANLMDVGYGVSQSLPILVDLLTAMGGGDVQVPFSHRRACHFLLQQPEVHLHPRGQAELGSFFVKSFRERGHQFLIETHSDYIVDRVRIAVRQGLIQADDVSIVYFEPNGRSVDIHNIRVDKDGNIEGAPRGYREFFSLETDRVLGFAD